jgi:hypothetical protein
MATGSCQVDINDSEQCTDWRASAREQLGLYLNKVHCVIATLGYRRSMTIQLRFSSVFGWPPLAWVAKCSDAEVVLAHGSRVEIAQGWFGEAVWPGMATRST